MLIWFMAFAAVLWSVGGNDAMAGLGWTGVVLASVGTAVMTVSPFVPDTQPLLNNYIPMLRQPVFVVGLLICGSGFALAIVRALATVRPGGLKDPAGALRLGLLLAAAAGAVAFAGFVVSWLGAPASYEPQAYYEALFWGGGHTLQFQHTLLAAVAWLWLGAYLEAAPRVAPPVLAVLLAATAVPVLAVPVIYLVAPVGSPEHIVDFAQLMVWGHPLMLPLVALAALSLPRSWARRGDPAQSALVCSVLLFVVGGILAYMIRGTNVVIPAHYHGSIVGVTLAFMGLTYVLLPRLGFGAARGSVARWQPYVYGGGQLLHILGLAWSGGYGVQRKVAGADQMLVSLPQKLGMGLVGLGGLIAIVGGLMFVLVCWRAMAGNTSVRSE